jgi:hypothetical protein
MVMRSRVRLVSDTSGVAALVIALALPFVVGGFGLGTEVGAWYFNQRKLQNAADVAAFAAATQVRAGQAQEVAEDIYVAWAEEAAIAAAARTGFRTERGTIRVVTPFGGNPDRVEVRLVEEVPRGFSAIFAQGAVDLGGRAVAEIEGDGIPSCVLALDTAGEGALTFQGNNDLSISGCNAHANSLHENAVVVEGNPRVRMDCISTAGGVRLGRDLLLSLTQCEAPLENAAVVPDPYAGLEPPTDVMNQECQPETVFGGGAGATHTISPGRYCGTLELRRDVTMEPGVYVVEGDVHITSTANVVGEGVTIYIKGTGEFRSNGTADVQLRAPTEGDYAGILLFADQPQGSTSTRHVMNGTARSFYNGAVYAPRGDIDVLGNDSTSGGCVQVVANRIRFTGNASVGVDCTGDPAMEPIEAVRLIRLVE